MNLATYLKIIFFSISIPSIAFAYVGPGAGVSAIGSALAFLAVVFLLIVGFLWYPLKKLFSRNKQKEAIGNDSNKKGSNKKDSNKNDEHSDQAKGL